MWFFRGQPALRMSDIAQDKAVVASAPGARTIAVLPFVNMSGDPANEYFSDGIAETTLDMLAQVPDLQVVARTSSFAFKGQSADVRKIGAALGAANVLEGSVQRAGDAVRITAQLVRATDGFHLWSRHFDRQLADVFKISFSTRSPPKSCVRSKSRCARAISSASRRNARKTSTHIRNTQGRFRLLPDRKVAGHARLPSTSSRLRLPSRSTPRTHARMSQPRIRTICCTSTARSRTIRKTGSHHMSSARWPWRRIWASMHAARGTELQNKLIAGAEREFARAIELAPSYATGFQWYGEFLGYDMHDFAGSERMLRRAVVLDPLSPIVQDQLVYPLMASNRFDAARVEADKLRREHPDFAQGYYTQSVLGTAQGDLVATLRAFREHAARDPAALGRFRDSCYVLLRFGAAEQARKCVDDLAARWPHEDLSGDVAAVMFSTAGAEAVLDFMKKAGHARTRPRPFSAGRPHDESLADQQAHRAGDVRGHAADHAVSAADSARCSRRCQSRARGLICARSGHARKGRADVCGPSGRIPRSMTGRSGTCWPTRRPRKVSRRPRHSRVVDRGALLDITDLDTDPDASSWTCADPRYENASACSRIG